MKSMEENLYTPDCIRTVTGKYVNVFDPKPEMFCIEDIAHALAMQPRFGGHLPHFYSVAQHSVYCSHGIPDDQALSGLMHDASEAYLMDIPRPIKNRLSNYKEIEHGVMVVLAEVFGFQYPLPREVKDRDEHMLEVEWQSRMIADRKMEIWEWGESKRSFMDRYAYLTKEVEK